MRLAAVTVIASAISSVAAVAATPVSVNLGATGTPFNPGVRGTAVPDLNLTRGGATVGNIKSLEVSQGSSIRGIAGGLEADTFDWRTRNFDARPTTLDYLRYSRDYDADLVITANVRGLTRPVAGATDGSKEFYDTTPETLAKVAADQVRYTNHIAQTYHQGDVITDPRDQAVLDSLVWSTPSLWYDQHDILPAPGEAPLPKVTYWEIGNEPRVGLANSYKISNSYTFYPKQRTGQVSSVDHKFDYTTRYATIVSAMKAEDPTIKVGPCLQSATAVTEKEILQELLAKQPNGQYIPVDFISYHPYQKMMDVTTPAAITAFINDVYNQQKVYTDRLRSLVTASGRNVNSVELIASEINVSNWPVNDTVQEAQMAHALGSVETVFSLARLGVSAAHYWVFPAHQDQGTEYPVYKAYEGLRDHMGDTILSTYADPSTRLYTTRDSSTGEIAIFGLNFSNDVDAQLALALSGLDLSGYSARLLTLRDTDGPTTLFSGNYAYGMPGFPAQEVDWVSSDLTLTPNYTLTLPAATMSIVVLDRLPTVPEPAVLAVLPAALLLRRRSR